MMPMKARAWLPGALMAGLLLGLPTAPALAQSGDGDGVTGRLIELLVKRGVLGREDANALLAEAKAEKAKTAKVAAKPAKAAPAGAAVATATAAGAAPPEEPVAPGTVRVTYVPQFVRNQIAQQVRADLMQTANSGQSGQAVLAPAVPDRFHFFGDLRIRGELDQLSKSNSPFPDFAALSSGSPFDTSTAQTNGQVPLLDTTHDRSRERLRARAGVDVDIDDGVTAEIRIATGNDGSPVTSNQTLGQNGDFTKYAVWLDRGFVKATPSDWLTAYAGRMPNPFWTTDMIYYDDLGFDGFAATMAPRFDKHWGGFLTVGAFPVFNTAFNFGSTSVGGSYSSRNAWLFAAQAGTEWQASKQISAKFAAGYFDYSNTAGKISSPCTIVFATDTCNTDSSRTLFPGYGNTMIPIRDIIAAPTTSTGVMTQPQYFGLASPFRILDVHSQLNLDMFKPIGVSFDAEFAMNMAYDRSRITALYVNGFHSSIGLPETGNKAGLIRVNVGAPQIVARWDWNMSLAYKYIESDSVLASLNDPDFHLGGTNAKGFVLGGNLGIARNTWLTAKWLSSTQVAGAPYSVDVIQADLNVKF
jgi:hypothetical protein